MVDAEINAHIVWETRTARLDAAPLPATACRQKPTLMREPQNAPDGLEHPTDLQIVANAKEDLAAFEPLYLRYEPIVRGYCQRRLGNPEIAADVTSQIFIRVLRALPSFRLDPSRPGNTFRAWLFTIAHNIVIDTRRRDRNDTSLDAPDHAGGTPIAESTAAIDPSRSPEEVAIANDLARQVHSTLTKLPERQRQIVELRLADLTGAEIAATLGMTLAAVKSAQFRAYATLRDIFDHPTQPATSEEMPDAS